VSVVKPKFTFLEMQIESVFAPAVKRQQQQIQQLIQKHRDQSTELERQISDEAH